MLRGAFFVSHFFVLFFVSCIWVRQVPVQSDNMSTYSMDSNATLGMQSIATSVHTRSYKELEADDFEGSHASQR